MPSSDVALAIAWSAGLLVIFTPIAALRYRRPRAPASPFSGQPQFRPAGVS